ncbi:Protein of unknown function [Gryllus bimaculatus]|nr:Protein of unknown function [Gryllus bimaculatus]
MFEADAAPGWKITIDEIATALQVSHCSTQHIVHDELKYQKVAARRGLCPLPTTDQALRYGIAASDIATAAKVPQTAICTKGDADYKGPMSPREHYMEKDKTVTSATFAMALTSAQELTMPPQEMRQSVWEPAQGRKPF